MLADGRWLASVEKNRWLQSLKPGQKFQKGRTLVSSSGKKSTQYSAVRNRPIAVLHNPCLHKPNFKTSTCSPHVNDLLLHSLNAYPASSLAYTLDSTWQYPHHLPLRGCCYQANRSHPPQDLVNQSSSSDLAHTPAATTSSPLLLGMNLARHPRPLPPHLPPPAKLLHLQLLQRFRSQALRIALSFHDPTLP